MRSLSTLSRDLSLFAKYHLVRRAVDYPAPETELGIVPLHFDIRSYVEDLRRRVGPFRVSTLAEVRYRGEAYPMLELSAGQVNARRRLLVLAGVHGNEHAGLLAVPGMLDRFEPGEAVALTILTPVNPVGAAHLSRYNAEGYDINRDFLRFDTPEARAVRHVFGRFAPDFVVSLHEGPQDATFLFANRRVPRSLAVRLLELLERGGTQLAAQDYFGRKLDPPGYAPMSASGYALSFLWARTLGMMATAMFAEQRGIPEITLESSWRLPDRESRVRAHVDLVLGLVDELTTRSAESRWPGA